MNRLALVAATGFLALALTACSEQGNPKPTATDTTTTTTTQQQTTPAPEQPAEVQSH